MDAAVSSRYPALVVVIAPAPTDRVLVVDDELDLLELLRFNLGEAGFVVDVAASAAEGLALAERSSPSVIVLDLLLPDLPGTEVCRRLRAHPVLGDLAVLMLTARGDEQDRVLGFEVGADDYVVKPFSVREVVLRVRALGRRAAELKKARAAADQGLRLGVHGLSIDPVRHRVFMDGVEVALRPLEYKLLSLLVEHPGRAFGRGELLEEVWGLRAELHTRTVDTHVRRLRERLGVHGEMIETVHGHGYRMRER